MGSVAETWIEAQPASIRADLRALDAAIRAAAPSLEVRAGAMLGYGPFRYRYGSGREGDAFLVSVAVRKGGVSVYVNAVDGETYVAEKAGKRLGKVKVGKSCIVMKKVADLDWRVFDEVLKKAVVVGGAGQVR